MSGPFEEEDIEPKAGEFVEQGGEAIEDGEDSSSVDGRAGRLGQHVTEESSRVGRIEMVGWESVKAVATELSVEMLSLSEDSGRWV